MSDKKEKHLLELSDKAKVHLEDWEFLEAIKIADEMLSNDNESCDAYFIKLLAENEASTLDELKEAENVLEENENYKKLISTGDKALVAQLRRINLYLKEEKGKNCPDNELLNKYKTAIDIFDNAETKEQLILAKNLFLEMSDFSDSLQMAQKAEHRIENFSDELYNKAVRLLEDKEKGFTRREALEKACDIFSKLGNFKDSNSKRELCYKEIKKIENTALLKEEENLKWEIAEKQKEEKRAKTKKILKRVWTYLLLAVCATFFVMLIIGKYLTK